MFLISPFTWFIVCLGLALFWKKEKLRRKAKWAAVAIFFLFSNSFIFLEFCRQWEIHGRRMDSLKTYDVGIVLTGMAEYNSDLKEISIRRGADRIWQAISLYHKGKIKKILITGDNGYVTDHGLHEAKQFKNVLIGWKIPEQDIITEERSRNTYENADVTKKLLDRSYPHMNSFLLITSGTHMRRALGCFEKVGLKCDTFSTDLYTGPDRKYFWDQYIIPDVSVFSNWNQLIKEWVGYVIYDIRGYI